MREIKCKAMTMEERKGEIHRLVEQFRANAAFYQSKDFVEAEARNKFIDPLLEALGWDVKNAKGARPDKREVITEDRVVIDGQVKHPDYTLCYGGVRKIYVEAKQPSVDLKEDAEPALQVRRYAYTSKMPIAILTDFQELAIYNTRIKPKANDTAATARIEYVRYEQYEEKFEELYHRISWEAVDLGDFETYWETNSDKKGTQSVDDDILQMIEKWRVALAEDIALHNASIDEFNLTSCVQKIIDRILFLRICEDKEIEERNQLKALCEKGEEKQAKDYRVEPDNDSLILRKKRVEPYNDTHSVIPVLDTGIYGKLKEIFAVANEKFNAGLFATDEFLDSLCIQDKTLKAIISALYFPECQYEFSVLPVEILGSIYERFLGKIIRFTRKTKNGHSVEIIEKPEVQKAGGVYYTPPYIVRYIVEQTIGKKIAGKTPEKIANMRFLDPACGSGSFLVGAYQYLLDYHLNYYLKEEAKWEKAGKIYKDATTHEYKLAIEEKRAILLNNIFGVDIDAQAVEVTKLSLFLKLLENEGRSLSKTGQAQLFRASEIKAKILPSMMNNIKCGNSLIGSDYYDDKDLMLFDIAEQRKINVFDWESQFPQVFDLTPSPSPSRRGEQVGGFDCVIGNPPYGAELSADERKYLQNKFKLKSTDTAALFVGLFKRLLKSDGIASYIIPKPFLYASNWDMTRKAIQDELVQIVDCSKVWKNVKLEQIIFVYERECKSPCYASLCREESNFIKIADVQKSDCETFGFLLNGITKEQLAVANKMRSCGQFLTPDICTNTRGAMYQKKMTDTESDFAVFGGKQIGRYEIDDSVKGFISAIDADDEKGKINDRGILVQNIVAQIMNPVPHVKIIATLPKLFDFQNSVILDTVNQLIVGDKYTPEALLAILNTPLVSWYVYMFIFGKAIRTMHFDEPVTSRIPIPNATGQEQAALAKLADAMMSAKKQLVAGSAVSAADKQMIEQRIALIDRQINAAVYKLYGLSAQDIAVVEK